MKTYNDIGEVYFVECSNCAKHSTEVNDYWNDNDELFICDCGHPMYDGWEDEEPEETETEKPLTIRAKLSHGIDHGFKGNQVTGLIVISISDFPTISVTGNVSKDTRKLIIYNTSPESNS